MMSIATTAYLVVLPLVDALFAPYLIEKSLKVCGAFSAARPVLESFVEDGNARMVVAH